MQSHTPLPKSSMLSHADELLAQKVSPVQVAAALIRANTSDEAMRTYLSQYETFLSTVASTPRVIAEKMQLISGAEGEAPGNKAAVILSEAMNQWMRYGLGGSQHPPVPDSEGKTGFRARLQAKWQELKRDIQDGILDDIVDQLYGLSSLELSDQQMYAVVDLLNHFLALKQQFDQATEARNALPEPQKQALVRSGVMHQPAYQYWVDVACDPMKAIKQALPDSVATTLALIQSSQEVFGTVSDAVVSAGALLASPFSRTANSWLGIGDTPFDTMMKTEFPREQRMSEARFLDAMAFYAYWKTLVGEGAITAEQKKNLFAHYYRASDPVSGLTFNHYAQREAFFESIYAFKWEAGNALSNEGRLYALYRLNQAYAEIDTVTSDEAINALLDECGGFYSAYSKPTEAAQVFYSAQFFPKFKCIPPLIQRQLLQASITMLADKNVIVDRDSENYRRMHAVSIALRERQWLSVADGEFVLRLLKKHKVLGKSVVMATDKKLKRMASWLTLPVANLNLDRSLLRATIVSPQIKFRDVIMQGLAWLKPDLLLEAVIQHVEAHEKFAQDHADYFKADIVLLKAKIQYCAVLLNALSQLKWYFEAETEGKHQGQYKRLADKLVELSQTQMATPTFRKRDMLPFLLRAVNEFGPVAGEPAQGVSGGALQQVLQFILTEIGNESLQKAYDELMKAQANRTCLVEGAPKFGMRSIWFDDALDDPFDLEHQGDALASRLLRSYLQALLKDYREASSTLNAAKWLGEYFRKNAFTAYLANTIAQFSDKLVDEQMLIDAVCRALSVPTVSAQQAIPYPKRLARVFFKVNAILSQPISNDRSERRVTSKELRAVVREVAGDLFEGDTSVPFEKAYEDIRFLCQSKSNFQFRFYKDSDFTPWIEHCFEGDKLNEHRFAVLMVHCDNLLAYARRFEVENPRIMARVEQAMRHCVAHRSALLTPTQNSEVTSMLERCVVKESVPVPASKPTPKPTPTPAPVPASAAKADAEVVVEDEAAGRQFNSALQAMLSTIETLKTKPEEPVVHPRVGVVRRSGRWHTRIKPGLQGFYNYFLDPAWVIVNLYFAISPIVTFVHALQAMSTVFQAFKLAYLASPLAWVLLGLHVTVNIGIQAYRYRKHFSRVWTFSNEDEPKTGLAVVGDIALRVVKTVGLAGYVLMSAVIKTIFTKFVWDKVEAVLGLVRSAPVQNVVGAVAGAVQGVSEGQKPDQRKNHALEAIEAKVKAMQSQRQGQDGQANVKAADMRSQVKGLTVMIEHSEYKDNFVAQLSTLQRAAGERYPTPLRPVASEGASMELPGSGAASTAEPKVAACPSSLFSGEGKRPVRKDEGVLHSAFEATSSSPRLTN